MDPRKLHSDYGLDARLAEAGCAYCGAAPDTVDHVPSKVFLDDPLPVNLPVVPACKTCNGGFSRMRSTQRPSLSVWSPVPQIPIVSAGRGLLVRYDTAQVSLQ